jgi:hypothetical protein
MRDNIFLTYVFADIVFVVSGGLLIIFALTTESEMTKAPTVATVARNLLFQQCPLQGRYSRRTLLPATNERFSIHRKCRSCFRHLPHFRSRDGYADDKRMVEVARIHDCRLRLVHHDSRLNALVPNTQNQRKSSHGLECSARYDSEFDSAGTRLLRILEQHLSTICG